MFARIKKSGKYQYLQIVENRKGSPAIRLRFGPHMREMVAGMILLKSKRTSNSSCIFSFLCKNKLSWSDITKDSLIHSRINAYMGHLATLKDL